MPFVLHLKTTFCITTFDLYAAYISTISQVPYITGKLMCSLMTCEMRLP